MPAKHAEHDPKHPHKIAVDAYGGDPLAPNDAMQIRIAQVVLNGGKDEQVKRWAHAFNTVCPEPVENQPRVSVEDWNATPVNVRALLGSPHHNRLKLASVAEAIESGKKNDEATEWAETVMKHAPKGAK